ncbi:MAG: cation:proton antiporter [Chloroflexota bacterium]
MLPFLQFIFAIAVIITAAKVGGYLSLKLGQPAVTGEVLAGLLLGPSVLNFLGLPFFTDTHLRDSIVNLAELGVLLLMFIAGLELHLDDLVKSGKIAVLAGLLGFVLTFGMGYILGTVFAYDVQQALFLGLMLAPTSIGISAQTLMELKVLKTKVGITLLGAATIDDMLGVLGVSLFLAFFGGATASDYVSVLTLLLDMSIYLVIAFAVGIWLLPKLPSYVKKLPISQGLVALAFIIMLFYAWSAEALGHMATVIGAFLAGIFLARSPLKDEIKKGLFPIAYGIFVPIFFSNVGLSADLHQISIDGLILLAGMAIVVVASKLLGAGFGSRLGDMHPWESLQLGFGMIPRGEVVLVFATVGITEGIIGNEVFSTTVMLVVLTTLATPPILRILLAKTEPKLKSQN